MTILDDGIMAILFVVFMFVIMSWAIAVNFYLIKLVLKKLNALPEDFPSFIFEKSSNCNSKHKTSKEKCDSCGKILG